MNEVEQVTQVAKSISDYGALVVIGAAFIVLSVLMWVAIFNWFKKMVDKSINLNNRTVASIEKKTDNINGLLIDIAESLKPTTLQQIKHISTAYFDLAIDKCVRIVNKVKTENHIVDVVATKAKIHDLVTNLHEDRNSKFDVYNYRGKPLSEYTSREWIEWVSDVIEKEVYSEKNNEARTATNVSTVYEKIKLDFYKKINGNGYND